MRPSNPPDAGRNASSYFSTPTLKLFASKNSLRLAAASLASFPILSEIPAASSSSPPSPSPPSPADATVRDADRRVFSRSTAASASSTVTPYNASPTMGSPACARCNRT
eukprot:30616-Pelagococcus_subviridis.AAC.3